MNKIIEIIKSYFKNLSKKDISYKQVGIRPSHDWNIMIISACVALILSVTFALYFYIQINNGSLFTIQEEVPSTSIIINQSLLKKTTENIDSKQKVLNGIQTNKVSVSDPSIY